MLRVVKLSHGITALASILFGQAAFWDLKLITSPLMQAHNLESQ